MRWLAYPRLLEIAAMNKVERMSAIRQYKSVVTADAGPETRRDDVAYVAQGPGSIETARHADTVEEAPLPRLFDLQSAAPRYLCIGFAVIRI